MATVHTTKSTIAPRMFNKFYLDLSILMSLIVFVKIYLFCILFCFGATFAQQIACQILHTAATFLTSTPVHTGKGGILSLHPECIRMQHHPQDIVTCAVTS